MKKKFRIAVFEGDGIGPEITLPAIDILEKLQGNGADYNFRFERVPAGAAHYRDTGSALPQNSIDEARGSDAILLSAMGLPDVRYSDGTEISPQIDLRMELGLYAGVRPVSVRNPKHCPLFIPDGERIDFVLVRESTEGLFYSMDKGVVTEDQATETLLISRSVSERLFEFSFGLAGQRKASEGTEGRVTCVDKANVFRAFAFFRGIFDEIAKRHPGIASDHAYVDAMALWMIQKPWAFDVLVTENMFGDILSDLGAGLMGGLGMAPSADIGENHAVFQPCHGSAPDIAGLGKANPLAMILSASMMLDWLGRQHNNDRMVSDARKLNNAVDGVVADGDQLTPDLGGRANTAELAQAVLDRLPGQ